VITQASPQNDAEGALLRGRAALSAARPTAGTEAARCASVREAFGEARRGLLLAPDDPALQRLANDVALRAVRITDCRI